MNPKHSASAVAKSSSGPVYWPAKMAFLPAMELKVFHTAIANYKIHGDFLRQDAEALHWVFGPLIKQVFELVDEDFATVMKSSTSSKVLVQVYGQTGGEVYWIPPGKCVCQCYAYRRGKRDYCKHILAAHIVLGTHTPDEYEEISETELNHIFKTIILKK